MWPLNSVVWGVCGASGGIRPPLRGRTTQRGLVLRVHPSFRLPFLGPGGTLHLGLLQSAHRVWVNWELVRCLVPRLVALAVAVQASPAAELEPWRLSPSTHTVWLFAVHACLGSPSIKSLHVSVFASFMNLVVPCLI